MSQIPPKKLHSVTTQVPHIKLHCHIPGTTYQTTQCHIPGTTYQNAQCHISAYQTMQHHISEDCVLNQRKYLAVIFETVGKILVGNTVI